MEVVDRAEADPHTTYVIAAVGFETTIPTYAVAMEEALNRNIQNIKF